MGMYSYFEDEDLEVKDMEGLKNFLERWKQYLLKAHSNQKEWVMNWDDNYYNIIQQGRVTFEKWDDIKLISYWYNDQVLFFKCIARYLEGRVYWTFENDDESGNIEFFDGKCTINIGLMNWVEHVPDDLLSGVRELEKETKEFILLEEI